MAKTHHDQAKKTVIKQVIPSLKEHPYWKKAFNLLVLACTITIVITGYNSSFHLDEMDMTAYGKANWKYLSSFGKDTSYLHVQLEDGSPVSPIIKTYGGFFEVIYQSISHTIGPFFGGEFNTRHLLCQLMGMIAIWIAGLLAIALTGRSLTGVCTVLLLFLTPVYFGHMMFNTKDIPFTMGYVLCIYGLLLFIRQKKEFKLKPFILTGLGFMACTGTRIGGLILLAYALAAVVIVWYERYKSKDTDNKIFQRQLLSLGICLACGFLLAISTWPFILSSPLKNITYALNVASKFPQRIPIVFDGVFTDSLKIPSYYLFKWMSITIPVFVMLLFIISALAVLLRIKRPEVRYYGFILLTILFPVFYAMYTKAALYSAWRHFLFIYPLMVAFSAYVFLLLLRSAKKEWIQYAVAGSCVIGMLHPIIWSVKNHPFEYVYFNEVSGGFAENYDKYETDYWQVCIPQAVKWLYDHEHIKEQKGVGIGSNAYSVTQYLVKHEYDDTATKVRMLSYKAKTIVPWKYMILSNLFIPPYVIENEFYPPRNSIYKVEIEGRTICAVVKDTLREDYRAFEAVTAERADEADSLSDIFLAKEPYCLRVLEISAAVKAAKKEWDACYKRCAAGLQYDPSNIVLRYYLGVYYAYNNEPQGAINNIEGALALGYRSNKNIYNMLSDLHTRVGNTSKARYYLNLAK